MKASAEKLTVAQVKKIIGDFPKPRPAIYWTDFLVSLSAGLLCFLLVRWLPMFSFWQAFFFAASCLLLFRVALFIHELAHLPRRDLRGFRVAWNLLFGIPFLMPSFLYWSHLDHHRGNHYGTEFDGEYLPFAHDPPPHIVVYLASSLFIPALAVIRFLVLTPLSWLSPRLRRIVHRHASSLVIDPRYVRAEPTAPQLRIIRLQELGCFVWCLLTVVALAAGKTWLWGVLAQAYLTAVVIITINALRTLGSHRWSNDGSAMSFVDQALDSVTYPYRPWFTELWGPIGMRHHTLHHLMPGLPYHALRATHRRLMEQLPADSPYRSTIEVSLTRALVKLWRQARTSRSTMESRSDSVPMAMGGDARASSAPLG